MARILSNDGFIHFEVPNYLWPYEPHLYGRCVPNLGKRFLRLMLWLQGKGRNNWYVNHLKFVTLLSLQRHLRKYGLRWHDRAISKLQAALTCAGDINKYRRIAKLLNILHRFSIGKPIFFAIVALGLYPRVLFILRKGTDE